MSEFERKALDALSSIKILLFVILIVLVGNTWGEHKADIQESWVNSHDWATIQAWFSQFGQWLGEILGAVFFPALLLFVVMCFAMAIRAFAIAISRRLKKS